MRGFHNKHSKQILLKSRRVGSRDFIGLKNQDRSHIENESNKQYTQICFWGRQLSWLERPPWLAEGPGEIRQWRIARRVLMKTCFQS